MDLIVIKRDGREVPFNKTKIKQAIIKAMKATGANYPDIARIIANDTENYFLKQEEEKITISQIEKYIFNRLCHYGQEITARAYENYRTIQEYRKQTMDTDEAILGLIRGTNEEAIMENSNKNAYNASTQRDLMAGEVSKSIVRRKILPPNFVQAHDNGIVHWHDMDYTIQSIHNCCLVNMKDILDNGTVINGHGIDSPHTFQTACNIATQVMAQVASGQYGGQTTSIAHLAPYVRKSYNKYIAEVIAEGKESGIRYTQKEIETIAMRRTRKEVQSGVQTIQYQINTLATSNGQSPFVSIYMDIYEDPEYEMEVAMIIEEILKQRILGMKNEAGVYIAPEFPKLLMVLRPEIVYENGKYNYLMPIIEECVAKRMVPDFISAKVMAENTGGYVYPCMGCRSFLSPWFPEGSDTPEFYGRANLGVVSLNLPDVALAAGGDIDTFWNILDERLNLCKEMILYRIGLLIGAKPEISPIHWKYGALARLSDEDTIDSLFHKFSCSLGYVGLCECVRALGYPSHTDKEGEKVALAIMQKLTDKCAEWKAETGYGFSVYGTPAESLIYKFARKTKERYGVIPGVTDKLYFTNSYHVHVTEPIDAFTKLKFESQFQKLSQGGCISYVEIPNLINNLPVIGELIKFIYENIQYAEINSKIDYCQVCGYDGQILIDENLEWYCPSCGNRDTKKMNVARRVCGYIGSNYFNLGKTEELSERVEHLD